MARDLSTDALTKLATNIGTEPICLIEISWAGSGRVTYADRELPGITGAILQISGLDDVVQVSGGSKSQQISLVLNDTDGSLKGIVDQIDIHKRPVWVYQWFNGLSESDKFLIFKGEISSPIEWDEGDRTLKFDVVSKIEDVEVGFSIEEGDFVNPPPDLIGRPWPLVFGTVNNVPALRINPIYQGILATGMGIVDFTLQARINAANAIICPFVFAGYVAHYEVNTAWGTGPLVIEATFTQDKGCAKSKCEIIENLTLQKNEQNSYLLSQVVIFGGELFPQNTTLVLNINGGWFTGKFSGPSVNGAGSNIFHITQRQHPGSHVCGSVDAADSTGLRQPPCIDSNHIYHILDPITGLQQVDPITRFISSTLQHTIASACPGTSQTVSKASVSDTLVETSAREYAITSAKYQAIPSAGFFWANAGSTVTLATNEETVYVANLIPSTILRVAAFRSLEGGRQLLTVPPEWYKIRQTNYTGYTGVMEIVFSVPLSRHQDGWEDEIYVTQTSSVGPNTTDILTWFINTYSPFGIDATSFAAVHTLVDKYPMHFWLKTRKNLLTVLEEIAYQARCALWLKDDVFYIKYLPIEPDADGTITEDDILPNTLKVAHNDTEDLVTKYVATWTNDNSNPQPNYVILRRNVVKYGTQLDPVQQSYDYYCFNILSLVRTAATFWLLRKAHVWRLAQFSTPLSKLNLETFDTVSLNLPDVSPQVIKGIVQKANYNSDTHEIDFEIWTPCISGTNTPYNFAWPSQIDETDIYPTVEDRQLGLAGSGKQPNFSVIAPKGHALANFTTGITGFKLDCNGQAVEAGDGTGGGFDASNSCRSDYGKRKISDRGDAKPTPDTQTGGDGGVNTGTSPISPNGPGEDCCAEAKAAKQQADQAAKDAKAAQQAAQQAANGKGGKDDQSQSDSDKDKKLPDDQQGAPCTASVTVDEDVADLITPSPASGGGAPRRHGPPGRVATSNTVATEVHTFNSALAAKEFADALQAAFNEKEEVWGHMTGDDYKLPTGTDPNLGNDADGNPCPEPGRENWKKVGFSRTELT